MSRRFFAAACAAMAAGMGTALLALGTAGASQSPARASVRLVEAPVYTAASNHLSAAEQAMFKPAAKPAAAPAGQTRLGVAPPLPVKAALMAAVPSATRMSATVTLQPQDPAGLSNFATAVSTPGTSVYHQYLTVSQFAAKYGATPAAVSAVRSVLTADGLTLAATSANNLSIELTGTADQMERAFSTSINQYRLSSGRFAYANTQAPAVSSSIASDVQAVIGLDDLYQRTDSLERSHIHLHALSTTARGSHLTAHAAGADTPPAGAASPCAAATSATTSEDAYTTNQFAQAYDYNPIYQTGDLGQGVTVGIFELENNFPADIPAYDTCYGISPSVSYVLTDGGATGTPSKTNEDGIETELDIENVVGLAPKATVDVYQAPNTDAGSTDQYTDMIDNPAIKVISTSWGECETLEGASDATAENTLFEQAATEGKSVVAAAGDDGSYDCAVEGPAVPTLAVDDPGSQPFVTSAGGTSLTALGQPDATTDPTPPTESVWNNGVVDNSTLDGGAGGGGISKLWDMPSYQSGAASYLNVINSGSLATTCKATTGDCREVPDVTASADLDYGYLVYWDGSFTGVGGTSGAAPLWASLFALADAEPACVNPIGSANANLYATASSSAGAYASDFNDITKGGNDPDSATGKYQAGTAYDMASGLGSPIAANLIPALCAYTNPPTTTTTTGTTTTGTSTTGTGTTTTGTTTTVTDTVTEPGTTTTVTEPGTTTTVTEPGTTTTVTETGTTSTVTQTGTTTTVTEPGTTTTLTETNTVTTPATTTTVTAPAQTQTVTTPGTTVTTPGESSTSVTYIPVPTSTPAKSSCTAGSMLSFVQTPKYPVIETKAVVYINNKKTQTINSRQIFVVNVKRPAATTFTLKLITSLNDGEVLSHQITYKGCTQTHVIFKTLHKINPGFKPSISVDYRWSTRMYMA